MNGQHLRALPAEELTKLIGERWKSTGLLTESEGPFVDVSFIFNTCLESILVFAKQIMIIMACKMAKQEAVQLLKDGIDLVTDSDTALSNLLSYPLHATLTR